MKKIIGNKAATAATVHIASSGGFKVVIEVHYSELDSTRAGVWVELPNVAIGACPSCLAAFACLVATSS